MNRSMFKERKLGIEGIQLFFNKKEPNRDSRNKLLKTHSCFEK